MTPLTRKMSRAVRTSWTSVSSDKMTVADIEESSTIKNGKMKFADADAENHDMIDVDKMRTEQMYDRMNFHWTKVQTFYQGQSE